MTTKLEIFNRAQLKTNLGDIRPGDTVRVHQRIFASAEAPTGKKTSASEKGKSKKKVQTFEGLIIAKKHGKEVGATIIVRKVISGVGVERIFPIHSPLIERIEVLKRGRVRRAKLYYLRKAKGKKAKLRKKEFTQASDENQLPQKEEAEPFGEASREEK